EQTAPLGRAVIGGLAVATFATLFVLPSVFAVVQGRSGTRSPSLDPDDPESPNFDRGGEGGAERDGEAQAAPGAPSPPAPLPPRPTLAGAHQCRSGFCTPPPPWRPPPAPSSWFGRRGAPARGQPPRTSRLRRHPPRRRR